MKRLFFVAAAIMAAVVSTRAEDKPEDWYKPNTWSGGAQGSATVVYRDGRTVESYTVTMDSDGKVNEDDWEYIVNQHSQDPAMLTALSALRKALESQVQIAYMGQRLNDLIGSKGITVKGKDPNGNEYTYTISLQKTTGGQFSKDGDGNIQGNTDASLSNYADWKTIEWATGGKAHLQLYGKPANAAAGEGKLPMFNGESLTWVGLKPYFDNKSLEAKTVSNAKIKDGGIQLRGWDTHDLGSDFKLGEVLTGDDEDTSSQVLVYNGGYLQYWHLGKLTAGGGHGVDDSSITTNEANGAVSSGNASLYGFVDAIADAGMSEAGTDAHVPFVKSESTHLEWKDPFAFFAPNVFEVDANKKITLKGLDGEDARVMVVTGTDTPNVSTRNFDNQSIIVGDKIGLGNWNASATGDIGAMLMNPTDTGRGNYAFLARTGSGNNATLCYIPLGSAICPPINYDHPLHFAVRGATGGLEWVPYLGDTTNDTQCACSQKWERIYKDFEAIGSDTHWDGSAQQITKVPLSWLDGQSIGRNIVYHDEDASMLLGLKDWPTAPHSGTDTFADIATNSEKSANMRVLVRNDDVDDPKLDYFPLGKILSGAAGAGMKVDGVTIVTNDTLIGEGNATINGASEAENKLFMSQGTESPKWIGVNGTTVEVSDEEKLEIKGYSTAEDGAVPTKSGNSLTWQRPSGSGCALRFIGWDGEDETSPVIVGVGSVTNDVRFSSADDSNVHIGVESDGAGGVEITIGVYYK